MIVLLEYLDVFQSQWQGTANISKGLVPARPALGYATAVIISPYVIVHQFSTTATGNTSIIVIRKTLHIYIVVLYKTIFHKYVFVPLSNKG